MAVSQRPQAVADVRRAICEKRYGPGRQVTDAFHQAWYDTTHTWGMTYWMGVPVIKNPLDLWVYQELIVGLRPGLIIETGTAFGGSAFFFAQVMDLVGIPYPDGHIVTIDIESARKPESEHPRVTALTGDSLSDAILATVEDFRRTTCGPVIVTLDSDHSAAHVRKELDAYSQFVTPGSFLIVEDTNVNGNPVLPAHGPGPHEAVVDFLQQHPEFAPEVWCEKYLLTMHPGGWLRRAA